MSCTWCQALQLAPGRHPLDTPWRAGTARLAPVWSPAWGQNRPPPTVLLEGSPQRRATASQSHPSGLPTDETPFPTKGTASLRSYLNCPLLRHSTFYPGPFKGKALSKPEQYRRPAGGRFFLPVASPGAPATAQAAADGGGGEFKRAGGRRCQLEAWLLQKHRAGIWGSANRRWRGRCAWLGGPAPGRRRHAHGRQTGLLSSAELKTNPKTTGLFNVIHSGYKYIKHYVFGD